VSVARFAKGFPAANHSLLVSRSVGMGWHLGAAAPCALPRHARAGGQGSQPDGRDHRQPKRQGRRKRGARIDPSGYDAGKKVKGKKRHILVDTLGLPLNVVVHPANIQDRDGGLLVLKAVRRLFPFIERIFADGGYQGEATAAAVRALGPWQLEIVKRSDHAVGFEVLPQRWIVERTFAWLGRCRRLAKDYENRTRFAVAYIHLAMIRLMLRRLTRQTD
jgi:transposase